MWSDKETLDDCLGFNNYVETLTEVCLEPGLAPLVLGVFGSWGSGKTSLMKMLEAKTTAESGVCTVWFNAWRYESTEQLQSALINAVINKLEKTPGLSAQAKILIQKAKKNVNVLRLAGAITKSVVTMTPDIDGVVSSFEKASSEVANTMADFEKDFDDTLKASGVSRVVVFIDDLDRCRSEQVIEAFETIKLFLNIPECTFVVGADNLKIQIAIEQQYNISQNQTKHFSEDYLEKIVQLPFRIPEQQVNDIACYVGMLALKPLLSDVGWNALVGSRPTLTSGKEAIDTSIRTWVGSNSAMLTVSTSSAEHTLDSVMGYVPLLASGLRGNPRQIKRFLNILELRRRLALRNRIAIDDGVLVKLLVVEYTFSDFFNDLITTYDPESGKSELLGALTASSAPTGEQAASSQMLQKALETPRLSEFLRASPPLSGEIDLSPYLFLAQTALGPHAGVALETPSETVVTLVGAIANEDAVRSRAGVRSLLVRTPEFVPDVVRTLLNRLRSETDPRVKGNVIDALTEIGTKHPVHFATVVALFSSSDVEPANVLGPAIVRLMDAAKAAGTAETDVIRSKYLERSEIARALSSVGRTRRSRS